LAFRNKRTHNNRNDRLTGDTVNFGITCQSARTDICRLDYHSNSNWCWIVDIYETKAALTDTILFPLHLPPLNSLSAILNPTKDPRKLKYMNIIYRKVGQRFRSGGISSLNHKIQMKAFLANVSVCNENWIDIRHP
jgi:hypothetical protein